MFCLIKSFFSFLFVLLLFCFIFLWIKKEHYVEKWLSEKLQTEVTVGSVALNGLGFKIRHLIINNPLGFPTHLGAFEAENITLKISPKSLLHRQINFNSIRMNKCSFNILFYNKQSSGHNWTHLLNEEMPSSRKIKTHIKKCEINSLSCSVYKFNKKTPVSIMIPHLEFYSKQYPEYNFHLPSLSQAIKSLLYLSLDEISRSSTTHGFYLNNSSIASEAHYFFESLRSQLSKNMISYNPKGDTEFSWKKEHKDTLEFLKEMFFG